MDNSNSTGGEKAFSKKKHKKKKTKGKHKPQVAVAGDGNANSAQFQQDEPLPPSKSGIQRIAVKQPSSISASALQKSESASFAPDSVAAALAIPADQIPKGVYGLFLTTRRVEELCQSLQLSYRDVSKLHQIFSREDLHGDGEITPDEFYTIIKEDKRKLTSGIFGYVGLKEAPRRLSFDDFVLCVATFAALTREELLVYAFTLFDKDDSGAMDESELRAFCGDLKNRQFFFAKNVENAQKKMADKDNQRPGAIRDGLIDLEDLTKSSNQFQAAFYPIMQMQRNIRAATLGESFWSAIVLRKQRVEIVVHYMRLHDGKLPPFTLQQRLRSILHPEIYLIRRSAILKHAEEVRIRKEQEKEQQKLQEEQ